MRRMNWLLAASLTLPLFGTTPEVICGPAQGKDVSVDSPSPKQLLRGRTTEIIFVGRGFDAIQAVEITPSEGVTAGDLKQVETKPEERSLGQRRWSLLLTVDASAASGERSMVVVTPQGRTKQVSIRIASHLPQISNLKVRSKKTLNADVSFSVDVFDEAGDIGTNTKVDAMIVFIDAGNISAVFAQPAPEKVEKKGPQKSVVYGRIFDQGSVASGSCELEVKLRDDSGVESNKLSTRLKF